jgi:hypothetical protein
VYTVYTKETWHQKEFSSVFWEFKYESCKLLTLHENNTKFTFIPSSWCHDGGRYLDLRKWQNIGKIQVNIRRFIICTPQEVLTRRSIKEDELGGTCSMLGVMTNFRNR